MDKPQLPKNVQQIANNEQFRFACHSQIDCFTDCCRHLELALTPYDVLRLKNSLGLSSSDFLEKYVIIEEDESDPFPRFYLTMVDDGKASCVFVTEKGCSVYQDRPAPCRAYPLGRAAVRSKTNSMNQFFVLLHEKHCHGFAEPHSQTPLQYISDQGMCRYNEFNDAIVPILQHEKIRAGMRLTKGQKEDFTLALYDLDEFRRLLFEGKLEKTLVTDEQHSHLDDDEKLLSFAITWLAVRLFETP